MEAKIFIANRGEIALRILRSCRDLGLPCVVAYSEGDRDSLAVRLADETVCIGPASASDSYLRMDRILSAALVTRCTAIHPGYGFLAENAHFAELCEECGLVFIGPTAQCIRQMGSKTLARKIMIDAGVPVTPGSDGVLPSVQDAFDCAERLGYPVILKASAGGGGKGMRVVWNADDMESAYEAAASEAERAFGDDSLFMEKFVQNPKHVEVQIFGDSQGNVIHLGERDCSLQRHHQKLIEESPCVVLGEELRQRMCETAVKAAKAAGYRGAGTVEYLLDDDGQFYFMEMNTRIQVEHPVSELRSGIDLVALQLRVALGEPLELKQEDVVLQGHAIEVRLNAEDPKRNFAPAPGIVTAYAAPGGPGVRMDSHVYCGYRVPSCYDSLLGKLIVSAPTREQALCRIRRALREYVLEGLPTTRDFALELLADSAVVAGTYTTGTVEQICAK